MPFIERHCHDMKALSRFDAEIRHSAQHMSLLVSQLVHGTRVIVTLHAQAEPAAY